MKAKTPQVTLPHQGTNGGEAYRKKCIAYWESVRFHVELAYLQEGSYRKAAQLLNRKRVSTMKKGAKWHPATVRTAILIYTLIDNQE